MAEALVDTLRRYGIEHKVCFSIKKSMKKLTIPQTGSVTADNATNNDTLMDALEVLLQEHGFRGRARRVRCFAHTLNLTAKATLRQFEKIKKRKKRTDDDEIPDYDDLPLLEPIDVPNDPADSDDENSDFEDLEDLAGMMGEEDEGSDEGKVTRDEEEIVNVFQTMTIEEQGRWREGVKPLRTALYKVGLMLLWTACYQHLTDT
jgi:hypothetical protein